MIEVLVPPALVGPFVARALGMHFPALQSVSYQDAVNGGELVRLQCTMNAVLTTGQQVEWTRKLKKIANELQWGGV